MPLRADQLQGRATGHWVPRYDKKLDRIGYVNELATLPSFTWLHPGEFASCPPNPDQRELLPGWVTLYLPSCHRWSYLNIEIGHHSLVHPLDLHSQPPNPDTRGLPPGWREFYDPIFREWFYVHDSQRLRPSPHEWVHPYDLEKVEKNRDTRPLPTGCISKYDPKEKKWYYVNIYATPHPWTWMHPLDHVPQHKLRVLKDEIGGGGGPVQPQGFWFVEDKPKELTGQISRADRYFFAAGGYSDVWIGYWKTDMGRIKVAVKVLRTHIARDDEAREKMEKRLENEIQIWSKLDHPNIVPLYGVAAEFGPTPSMVSPWYEKGNLMQYCIKMKQYGGCLPQLIKIQLLCDIAAGLSYLHNLDVVHGDLKGPNILINDKDQACLTDFGLSKIIEDGDTERFTSTLGGTLRWVAPEVHCLGSPQGTRPSITAASDIYSFGSVILEVLTDEAPYWDLEDVRVPIELYLGNKPNTPPEVKIDQVHRDLMRWCWETDPHARPTITQAHEVLKDFILGHWQYV